MELEDQVIEIGELVQFDQLFIYRNEYAYLIFRRYENTEYFGNLILINGIYYCAETVEDLRSYKIEDFI